MTLLPDGRLDMALNVYGLPYTMGQLPLKGGALNPSPMTVEGFLDAAVALRVSAVDMELPKPDQMSDEAFADALRRRGLRLVVEYMGILECDAAAFGTILRRAGRLGARVVRVCMSRLLCGDRRNFPGGWDAHFAAVAARLREVLPVAHDLGLSVAVENHQDCGSDDLLRLWDLVGNHPAYGVTLDAGNPLAVGEGLVEFVRRTAHLIRHVHCKDYTIHFAPEGYRLVRCAAGSGVVPFPEIMTIVLANGHGVLPGIEVAAQATRTIPLLDDAWWACYPARQKEHLVEALRTLWVHGIPADVPYSSAWERGEGAGAVTAEEWDVLRRSVDYFQSIAAS